MLLLSYLLDCIACSIFFILWSIIIFVFKYLFCLADDFGTATFEDIEALEANIDRRPDWLDNCK